MQTKTIFIFGNPDLENDSLPIKLIPELKKAFSTISFEIKDPNEEWDVPPDLTIIDTVLGPKDVTVFNELDEFIGAPQLSMHDFDALANLRYLKKLGKLKKIMIIGVPPEIDPKEALTAIKEILTETIVKN